MQKMYIADSQTGFLQCCVGTIIILRLRATTIVHEYELEAGNCTDSAYTI